MWWTATPQCSLFCPPVKGSSWNIPEPQESGRKERLCRSSGCLNCLETFWFVTGAGRCGMGGGGQGCCQIATVHRVAPQRGDIRPQISVALLRKTQRCLRRFGMRLSRPTTGFLVCRKSMAVFPGCVKRVDAFFLYLCCL